MREKVQLCPSCGLHLIVIGDVVYGALDEFKEEVESKACKTCRHWKEHPKDILGGCVVGKGVSPNLYPNSTCDLWQGHPREPVQLPGDTHPII